MNILTTLQFMNQQLTAQYDSLYAAKDNAYNDGLPQRAAKLLPKYVTKGSVLDAGAGQGQNSLWLAGQGFKVTALDLSEVGLQQLRDASNQSGLEVETVVGDIQTYAYPSTFDAVLFSFVLHHLPDDSAVAVLEAAKAETNPGGVHIIATFSDQGGLYERAKKSGRYYPAANDLKALYADWEICETSTCERESLAKDKNGTPLKNDTVLLVARKVNV